MVFVSLRAKRKRVLEVKLHRVAVELEALTGLRPTTVQGGESAVLCTGSWIAPEILVRLLRARLEQERPNGGMFHFSQGGDAFDSITAVEATRVASL